MLKLQHSGCRYRITILLTLHLLLVCGIYDYILAEDCANIAFEHKSSEYYGPGQYFMTCPDDGVRIRCYHYHRHWICEKGEILYWDRRLESAARTACGCPLPPDTEPVSPAISGKPKAHLFDPEDR